MFEKTEKAKYYKLQKLLTCSLLLSSSAKSLTDSELRSEEAVGAAGGGGGGGGGVSSISCCCGGGHCALIWPLGNSCFLKASSLDGGTGEGGAIGRRRGVWPNWEGPCWERQKEIDIISNQ
jgi:hypothetical protein